MIYSLFSDLKVVVRKLVGEFGELEGVLGNIGDGVWEYMTL